MQSSLQLQHAGAGRRRAARAAAQADAAAVPGAPPARCSRRRTEFELEKARARAHILEGLKIALDNLDAVIRTIRGAASADEAPQQL